MCHGYIVIILQFYRNVKNEIIKKKVIFVLFFAIISLFVPIYGENTLFISERRFFTKLEEVIKMGCKENFKNNLRYFTKESGLDRKSICSELHVSYTTFSEWWQGRHLPKDNLIDEIANVLHIPVKSLFEDEVTVKREQQETLISGMINDKPKIIELIKVSNKLSVDKLDFIIELIRGYKA